MNRRFLALFLSLGCVFFALACNATTSTSKTKRTTTTEERTTGSFLPWRDHVYAFFSDTNFPNYSFVEAKWYSDPDNPTQYSILDINGLAVKYEVEGMFNSFDISAMYPARNPYFAEYDIRFQNGTKEFLITLTEVQTEHWVVSFIYFENGVEGDSQQYGQSAFPDNFDPLLSLLEESDPI